MTSVFQVLSDPARSTRFIFDVIKVSVALSLDYKMIVKIQCDLEELWLIGVDATCLEKFPIIKRSIPSYSVWH